MTHKEVLLKFWGYASFRPKQEEIIQAVLEGKDCLALLPTGGGKSICFQVPAMVREGLCLVISPLIALMKDQVENLNRRGIKALSIHSGMTYREIDIALDNCAYGAIKFLYVSPERLATQLFMERLKKMKVNLIAVDEAHCISQWGYDFRPSYLEIASIRTLLPKVPILALTATATTDVVQDVQERLLFKSEFVIQSSFERKNLAYVCLNEEDKMKRALKVIENVKGTGIIYVRSRKKTREIADFLRARKYAADFYHAGLNFKERNTKQEEWSTGKTQIIVSTNAFGMGIDVPHVRFVIHLDLPDSLEAYFQEAGRAGRDGKKAYAVALYNQADKIDLEKRHEMSFPPLEEIKRVYTALGNFFQIPIGGGKDQVFNFDISVFNKRYNFNSIPLIYNSLNYLGRAGLIEATDAIFNPSKVLIKVTKTDLYKLQVKHPLLDAVLKVILRSYPGLFDDYVKISETDIAERSKLSLEKTIEILERLKQLDIIDFIPRNNAPKIYFIKERLHEKQLKLPKKSYHSLKNHAQLKSQAVWEYVSNDNKCRSILLMHYFGENKNVRCGICDFCVEQNKLQLNALEFEQIKKELTTILAKQKLTSTQLVDKSVKNDKVKVIQVLQWLLEHGEVKKNDDGTIELK